MHIEIIGSIASGKTTLAQLLREGGLPVVLEDFRSNPLWAAFYADPVGNAFETELTFTLQHYHEIKQALRAGKPFACDFSLVLDQAYADVTLSGKRHTIYSTVLQELWDEIGFPRKLIHLSCPEAVLLERIRARKRKPEEAITLDYLQSLTRSIQRNLERLGQGTEIIEIDSRALDFAGNAAHKQEAVALALSAS